MTFTVAEAEQILREQWDDASIVGGFVNDWDRTERINEFREEYGDVIDAYVLLGVVYWSDYEEGSVYSLWVKIEDQTLWFLESGHTVYGDVGETFADIRPADMNEWLSYVESCLRHAEEFIGC